MFVISDDNQFCRYSNKIEVRHVKKMPLINNYNTNDCKRLQTTAKETTS